MDRMDSKYHVGDKVFICDSSQCVWGSNHNMRELHGKTRVIKKVFWAESKKCYGYYIKNDNNGTWKWDDSCFEPAIPIDLPEFNAGSMEAVLDLFS